VIPTISSYLLPAIVPAVRDEHPALALRWIEDKTEVLVRRVEDGELDVALLALEADLGPRAGDLAREVIGRDRFVLAAPRTHPLAASTAPASLDELGGSKVLLLDDGHCLRDQALAFCSGVGAEELGFRATSLPTLAQMVSAGAGITLLPEISVGTESRRSALAIRPLADPRAYRTIGLVWRSSSPLGRGLRRLGATIRKSYETVLAERPSANIRRRRIRKR
jgi:LysR family hydrogen peroxide-inducible transcriptional activator